MNERIKELDKAAQEYAGTIAGNDEDSNYALWFNIYKEKFSKLMVEEFQTILHNNHGEDTGTLSYRVEEHFGVKE